MMDLQPSSFNQTTNMAECAVCHQPIPKGRVHYGGVSCYSCRAFFRRNTQREELPTCKNGSSCRVTYQDRKQCSACRYSKCLTIGMRRELVLDANGKQERFKKYLRKKNEERLKAEELSNDEVSKPMPPLQPIPSVGFPLNVLLQQMQPFYPEPQTSFPPHHAAGNPPQHPSIPLPFRFPMSGNKMVDASRIPSPPPASPHPVDLTSQPLHRRASVTSPSISSPVKYMPSYHQEQIEEFSKTDQLPPLTKLHRNSVIANPVPPKKVFEKESQDELERESSSERDEASSSKRRYWPLHPLLENSLPLHVEIKEEPEQEQEPVTEESLLQKYCHKKFQKAKTFSSDLRPPVSDSTEFENRKRRSVIVQAPSSKKLCNQDLKSFRISKPNLVETEQEQEQQQEEGSPVDLSCSSPTFQHATWPSPTRRQSTERLSDQEVPIASVKVSA